MQNLVTQRQLLPSLGLGGDGDGEEERAALQRMAFPKYMEQTVNTVTDSHYLFC